MAPNTPTAGAPQPAELPVWRWAPYSIGAHLALPLVVAPLWFLGGQDVTFSALVLSSECCCCSQCAGGGGKRRLCSS